MRARIAVAWCCGLKSSKSEVVSRRCFLPIAALHSLVLMLRERGIQRAQSYRWALCAERHMELYQEIASGQTSEIMSPIRMFVDAILVLNTISVQDTSSNSKCLIRSN